MVERHTHWARIIKDIHVPVEGSKLYLVWAERNHPPPQPSLASLAWSTYLSILVGWSLTLSYSSKINSYLHHQRVSQPLKKTPWYVIRGQCCHSRWVWQPSADSNCCMAQFFLNSNFLGQAWHPLLTIMVCQTAITIGRGLSHSTRSLSRIVCKGQEHPKDSKGTLRPDFQASTTVGASIFARTKIMACNTSGDDFTHLKTSHIKSRVILWNYSLFRSYSWKNILKFFFV